MYESVGKNLKKIRESKHLSIEEISGQTHIPKKIISAIEENGLENISSPFYIRGFVKMYARFLKALEEKAIKEYLVGTQQKDLSGLIPREGSPPKSFLKKYRKNVGIGILVIFSLWILGFCFIWVAGRISLFKDSFNSSSSAPTKPKEIQNVQLEITARYNSWIQVLSDGELLFRGILKKGTKDVWQANKEIELKLGNAGGVTLELNDKKLGSLGKKGEKKTVIITKDGIK